MRDKTITVPGWLVLLGNIAVWIALIPLFLFAGALFVAFFGFFLFYLPWVVGGGFGGTVGIIIAFTIVWGVALAMVAPGILEGFEEWRIVRSVSVETPDGPVEETPDVDSVPWIISIPVETPDVPVETPDVPEDSGRRVSWLADGERL